MQLKLYLLTGMLKHILRSAILLKIYFFYGPMFPTERTGISKLYFFYQPLPCIYSNKRYLKNDLKIVTSSVCDNITNKLECIVQYI